MLNLECKPFGELSTEELYRIMWLRQEVFIVEQNCVFSDLDYKDQKAWHCMAKKSDGQIVAYTRLFDENDYYEGFLSIGRVVSIPTERKEGFGRKVFDFSVKKVNELFGNKPVKIGAQAYLEMFYESFGFKSINQDYIEDGIEHKLMVKEID